MGVGLFMELIFFPVGVDMRAAVFAFDPFGDGKQ